MNRFYRNFVLLPIIGISVLILPIYAVVSAEVKAGDAGDINAGTFTGDFKCKPSEVAEAYGKKFTILADGVDVCSWEYAAQEGFSRPRKPVYQDLSDKAGWPDIHVKSGTVAIDPETGRFKFAEGDTKSGIERKHFVMTPHGFTRLPVIRGRVMFCFGGETWTGVRVVDISDPSHPRDMMTFDIGCTGGSGAELGNRIYCHTGYNGTTILDISNPERPHKIGHWRIPPPSNHNRRVVPIRIGTNEYFYCYVRPDGNWKDWPKNPVRPEKGLRLVDVTDPAHPITENLGNIPMFVAANGHYTYTSKQVFDVSKPAAPVAVGNIPGPLGHFVFLGNRIYALRADAIVVLDNSHPEAPQELGMFGGFKKPGGLAVVEKKAYVVSGGNKLTVLDVSNPSAIQTLGSVVIPLTKKCGGVTLTPDGKIAVVLDDFGYRFFDVSNPGALHEVGRYYSAGEIQHLLVNEDQTVATVSLEWGGVQAMLDVSDPLKAKIVGYYYSGQFDNYTDVFREGVMYFGKGRKKIVVDVTDPSNPRETGSYTMDMGAYFPVRFWKDTGFAIGSMRSKNEQGGKGILKSVLNTYDYSNPLKPVKLGSCELADFTRVKTPGEKRVRNAFISLATDGKLLVAVGPNRLVTVDVTNQSDPKILGKLKDDTIDPQGYYKWQGSGRRLGLRKGYAYGIRGSEALDDPRIAVYDVRDHAKPRFIYVTPETVPAFQDDWFDSRLLHQGDMFNDLVIEGRYMYVCDYWGGVRVYDLKDPEKPVCVDWEFTPYLQLMPKTWSRAEYKKAVASGDIYKYLGITPEKWAERFEIGHKLSWLPFEYYPGYELFAWNIGELIGDYLSQPKLSGVAVYKIKRSPEAPAGKVVIKY